MLGQVVLLALALAVGSLLVGLVLVGRRAVLSRRRRRSDETRVMPLALAIAHEEDPEIPDLSYREGVALAGILDRFARQLQGRPRQQIVRFLEERGEVLAAIQDLSDRRSWRRATAAYKLGDTGSVAATPALISALDDGERDVRSAAARSLGRLGGAQAVAPLLHVLTSRRVPRWVAGQAVLALGSSAAPELIRLLDHPHPEVRATTAELIGLLGDAGEAGPLLGRLGDVCAAVRERAALALGRLGSTEAYDHLVLALEDHVPAVRAAAAEGLGLIADPAAFPMLVDVARGDLFDPARAAARAAARVAPERLHELARDQDAGRYIREAADMSALVSGG